MNNKRYYTILSAIPRHWKNVLKTVFPNNTYFQEGTFQGKFIIVCIRKFFHLQLRAIKNEKRRHGLVELVYISLQIIQKL